MSDFSRIGQIQNFEWGTLQWVIEPDNPDIERMSVGIITFIPHSFHAEHLHSGDEQVIYTISGRGIQSINDENFIMEPGNIRHIPPYARHKVINNGPEELKLIIVYTPSKFQRLLARPAALQSDNTVNMLTFIDYNVLRELLNKLAKAIDLNLTVIGGNGEFLVSTDNHPGFCSILTRASDGQYCRRQVQQVCSQMDRFDKPHLSYCCCGIASILVPIFNGEFVVGYIKCGQIFLSKPDLARMNDSLGLLANTYHIPFSQLLRCYLSISIQPKSRLYAAAEATFAIANYIADMVGAALRQRELDNSRISLVKEQMASAKLEKALREADVKLLQSQINPHFLFNTLNTIGQMAYVEGADKAADLIWCLSGLLRSTLRKTEELIPLAEEIKMLENYLHIQLTRFRDRLQVALDVAPGLADIRIPCMLLQPLVENAIIHGFEKKRGKGTITVSILRAEEKILCLVEDDGLGFDVKSVWPNNSGVGLSSVNNRLRYYFKEDYTFQIDSNPGKGTKVTVLFPATGGDCSGKHQNSDCG